jgi:hypothetical protein
MARKKRIPALPGLEKSDWSRRRRVLYLGLIFCAGWISWVLYKGTDTILFQNALYVLGGGGVALIGQYVFGAAYDDKNYMSTLSSLHRSRYESDSSGDDPVEETTTTTVRDAADDAAGDAEDAATTPAADRPMSGGR